MRGRWSVAALVAFVVLCAGLSQTGAGQSLLRDTGAVGPPPSYTQLAFTAPRQLPAALKSDHASLKVSFGIHNSSTAAQSYRWSILLTQSAKTSVSASGVVAVQAQSGATVAKKVAAVCGKGKLHVMVKLADPKESIDFFVTCP